MAVNLVKKCACCGSVKGVSAEYFHANKNKSDGLSSTCKECAKARSRLWHVNNKERASATAKKFRSNNKGEIRARHKEWTKANRVHVLQYHAKRRDEKRDHINANLREWARRNRNKVQAWSRGNRARRAGVGGRHSAEDVSAILLQQRNLCATCEVTLTKFHVDHVMPIILGGNNDKSNLQILCPPCNWSKGGKHPELWKGRDALIGANHGR